MLWFFFRSSLCTQAGCIYGMVIEHVTYHNNVATRTTIGKFIFISYKNEMKLNEMKRENKKKWGKKTDIYQKQN